MSLKELMSGYGGFAFPLPEIAGKYKGGGLIICGDAACIWDDLERFGARDDSGPRGRVRKVGWDIMTINKIVEVMPANVEHAYSNAGRVLDVAIAARRDEYAREFGPVRNTHAVAGNVQWRWPWGGHGTSGLGACLVGLGLGYDYIMLCGVPLDDGPHNGEPPWRRTAFASSEAAGSKDDDRDSHWKRAIKLAFEGKVKSMSGRTKKWLDG